MEMKKVVNVEILAIEFIAYDINEKITIKEYLKKLLKAVWINAEGFSGKRPFGDSGWQYGIMDALKENGYIEDVSDHGVANKLMSELIDLL